jgi:hypothetical protein
MFRKRVWLTIGLALACSLLAGLAAARVVAGRRTAANPPQAVKTQGNKQEEPTPIQEGVMTEKQKKNSKLFKGYEGCNQGEKTARHGHRAGRCNGRENDAAAYPLDLL